MLNVTSIQTQKKISSIIESKVDYHPHDDTEIFILCELLSQNDIWPKFLPLTLLPIVASYCIEERYIYTCSHTTILCFDLLKYRWFEYPVSLGTEETIMWSRRLKSFLVGENLGVEKTKNLHKLQLVKRLDPSNKTEIDRYVKKVLLNDKKSTEGEWAEVVNAGLDLDNPVTVLGSFVHHLTKITWNHFWVMGTKERDRLHVIGGSVNFTNCKEPVPIVVSLNENSSTCEKFMLAPRTIYRHSSDDTCAILLSGTLYLFTPMTAERLNLHKKNVFWQDLNFNLYKLAKQNGIMMETRNHNMNAIACNQFIYIGFVTTTNEFTLVKYQPAPCRSITKSTVEFIRSGLTSDTWSMIVI
jgi:hypothetical protein